MLSLPCLLCSRKLTGALGPPPVEENCCYSRKQSFTSRYNPHFSISFFSSWLYLTVISFWFIKKISVTKKIHMRLRNSVVGLQETCSLSQVGLNHWARAGPWIRTERLHTRRHSAITSLPAKFYFHSLSRCYAIIVMRFIRPYIVTTDSCKTHDRLTNPS